MTDKNIKEIERRIVKLNKLEIELNNFDGRAIPVTRLTILKYLCRDCLAMLEFAYFISNKVTNRLEYSEDNILLQRPINESLQLMKKTISDFVNNGGVERDTQTKLFVLQKKIIDHQNTIETQKWSDVRIIHDWNILLIEEAISCFLNSEHPQLAYRLARSYTEKHNSRFGTGLVPESLEYLKEVNIYWQDYLCKLKKNTIANTLE